MLVKLSLLLLILISTQAPIQGQSKAEPKQAEQTALSEQEQQQIAQAAQLVRERAAELQQALNAIAGCPLEASKTLEVVAKVQAAMARSQAAQAEFDKSIAVFQARHSCPDCLLTPNGKALIRPSKEEKQK